MNHTFHIQQSLADNLFVPSNSCNWSFCFSISLCYILTKKQKHSRKCSKCLEKLFPAEQFHHNHGTSCCMPCTHNVHKTQVCHAMPTKQKYLSVILSRILTIHFHKHKEDSLHSDFPCYIEANKNPKRPEENMHRRKITPTATSFVDTSPSQYQT